MIFLPPLPTTAAGLLEEIARLEMQRERLRQANKLNHENAQMIAAALRALRPALQIARDKEYRQC